MKDVQKTTVATLTLAKFKKDTTDLASLKVAIPGNVVNPEAFTEDLKAVVNYLEYARLNNEIKATADKLADEEKKAKKDRDADKVEGLTEKLANLNAVKDAYIVADAGATLDNIKTKRGMFTLVCGWSILSNANSFRPGKNLDDLVPQIRGYYKHHLDRDEDHKAQKVALKKEIVAYVNNYLHTDNESGVYKNFNVDHLTDDEFNTIITSCASGLKWGNKGITSGKKDSTYIARQIMLTVLKSKLKFTESDVTEF